MRGRRTTMAIAAGIAVLTGGVLAVDQASASVFHRTTSGHTAAPELARYYDQSISWHGCQTGPEGRAAR